jgi:hypothetical protein
MTGTIEQHITTWHDMNQDDLLKMLIMFAFTAGISIPITLNVKGTIISGDLIGGREYFEHYTEQVDRQFQDPKLTDSYTGDPKQFHEIHYQHIKTLEKLSEMTYGSKDDTTRQPASEVHIGYIHLKNAQFIFPNGKVPTSERALWRGKLLSVDGFSLGKL